MILFLIQITMSAVLSQMHRATFRLTDMIRFKILLFQMSGGSRKTRQVSAKNIVQAGDLPSSDLPTLRDVLAKMILERDKIATKIVEVKALTELVLPEIKAVYRKVNSNLIINSDKTILKKLTNDYKYMKELERSGITGKKRQDFEVRLGRLFDIVNCKCQILPCVEVPECGGCDVGAHSLCGCDDDQKIPQVELLYVLDQRLRESGCKGKFQMGGKDIKEMDSMKEEEKKMEIKADKKRQRNEASERLKEKERIRVMNEAASAHEDLEQVSEDFVIDLEKNSGSERQEDEDFRPKPKPQKQNRQKLRNLAMICDRYGVSSRAGAAIANAALADAGVIGVEDQSNVIDKNKLRRAIDKFREERKVADQDDLVKAQGEAYYFDGKKDKTLAVGRDENGKMFNYYQMEEHISMSSEPGGKYVSHLTPTGDSGAEIGKAVVDYLTEHGVVDSWNIIGGDSTACNTGVNKGCFVLIEKTLQRRLFRVVCTLHLNELPWRHVFIDIDGPTDSKNTFQGVIGKLLPNVEELDWNPRFKKFDEGPGLPNISEELASDLSSDQHLLFLVYQSVKTGTIRPELYSLTPGPVSHSRWLTHAIRVLVLYMKRNGLKGKDKANLDKFVKFLMTNYIVMWFRLKQKPSICEAPRHLFSQIQLLKLLPPQVRSIAKNNIARNAYWAHTECLLLSMLTDSNEKVRSVAVDKILSIKKEQEYGDKSIRKFLIPQLRFDTAGYTEMIDWYSEALYEPCLTAGLTSSQVTDLKYSALSLPSYPAHTQSVERLVKQTTGAAESVAGYSARDGFLVPSPGR